MPTDKINLKDRLNENELDLSMSDLQEVPVEEISKLQRVSSLDVSNNRLSVLSNTFAPSLCNIVKLDLSQNQLKELPENFGLLRNLGYLDLYNNRLQHLPLSLGLCKHLRWLDVKNNPLVPAMAEVAGPCLDAKQCQQSAKKVVSFLNNLEQKITQERERRGAQKKRDTMAHEAKQALIKREQNKSAKKAVKAEKKLRGMNIKKDATSPVTKDPYEDPYMFDEDDMDAGTPEETGIDKQQGLLKRIFILVSKFCMYGGLICTLAIVWLSIYDQPRFEVVKEIASSSWNASVAVLPPAVVTYTEPAVKLVINTMYTFKTFTANQYQDLCDSQFAKGLYQGFCQTYRTVFLKAAEVYEKLLTEVPVVLEQLRKRFFER